MGNLKSATAACVLAGNLIGCSAAVRGEFDGAGGHRLIAIALPHSSETTLRQAASVEIERAAKEGETVRVIPPEDGQGYVEAALVDLTAVGSDLWACDLGVIGDD